MPIIGIAVVLGLELAVAQASGSGWVQALGSLAVALALVGVGGPAFSLSRTHVSVTAAPLDATSGGDCVLTVVADRPCRIKPVRPTGSVTLVPAGRPTEVRLRPGHRGVIGAVAVDVSTAAPFAIVWWAAPRLLRLPRPITVAPVRERARHVAHDAARDGGGLDGAAPFGEPGGIRPYQPGDSPRRLHWRATAHSGHLMVREEEANRSARVVARLPEDPDAGEREASRQLDLVATLLARGVAVHLETVEEGRLVLSSVRDERTAGRRLARAGLNPWRDLAGRGEADQGAW